MLILQTVFWLGFILPVVIELPQLDRPFTEFLFKLARLAWNLLIGYLHVLVLLPLLLERKKTVVYMAVILLLIFTYPYVLGGILGLKKVMMEKNAFHLILYTNFFIRPILILAASVPFYFGLKHLMQLELQARLKEKKSEVLQANQKMRMFLTAVKKELGQVADQLEREPEEASYQVDRMARNARTILNTDLENN